MISPCTSYCDARSEMQLDEMHFEMQQQRQW
jgi:hypothetical protein